LGDAVDDLFPHRELARSGGSSWRRPAARLGSSQQHGGFFFGVVGPNWRNGHEFGTTLPVNQKKDLLELLKTL